MRNSIHLMALLLLSISGMACSQTEEITINKEATKPGSSALETKQLIEYKPESVTALKIGALGKYTHPDPLAISSNTMLRTASLIYEGLTELTTENTIVPAIARSWEVNEDSTLFTFHINRSVHYHDSDAFLNGMGRPVSAEDVLFTFKRMAQPGVFPAAFEMFKNIRGFDAMRYQSLLPDYSNPSISGIKVENDSTIHFSLIRPDGNFLHKLAHPFASVYAPESLNSQKTAFTTPIGTDKYRYGDVVSDSVLILQLVEVDESKKESDNHFTQLHIYYSTNERSLYKFFAKKRLQLLPEIGPATVEELIQPGETALKSSYQDLYQSYQSGDRIWDIYTPIQITSIGRTKNAFDVLSSYSRGSAYYSFESSMPMLSDASESYTDSSNKTFYTHSSSVNRINYLLLKSGLVSAGSDRYKITNQSYICSGVELSFKDRNMYIFGIERMETIGTLQTPVFSLTHKSGNAPLIQTNSSSWWISIDSSPQ